MIDLHASVALAHGAAAAFWGGVRRNGAVISRLKIHRLEEPEKTADCLHSIPQRVDPIANWPSSQIAEISECDTDRLRQKIEHSSPLMSNENQEIQAVAIRDLVWFLARVGRSGAESSEGPVDITVAGSWGSPGTIPARRGEPSAAM